MSEAPAAYATMCECQSAVIMLIIRKGDGVPGPRCSRASRARCGAHSGPSSCWFHGDHGAHSRRIPASSQPRTGVFMRTPPLTLGRFSACSGTRHLAELNAVVACMGPATGARRASARHTARAGSVAVEVDANLEACSGLADIPARRVHTPARGVHGLAQRGPSIEHSRAQLPFASTLPGGQFVTQVPLGRHC
jgi:hypothetical protein